MVSGDAQSSRTGINDLHGKFNPSAPLATGHTVVLGCDLNSVADGRMIDYARNRQR